MKILISGSNGLIAQKIIRELNPDYHLYATSLHIDRSGIVPFKVLDIRKHALVNKVFEEFRPDIFIHTAAITQVDLCEENKELCFETNTQALKNIISACNRLGTRLIHFSSDFVFDGTQGPYSESDVTHPISYYGWTKMEAEREIESTCKDWAIIRTILVYGFEESVGRSNLMLWVIKSLLQNKKINVVNDQYRMPTLAEDLAKAVRAIIEKNEKGIFHFSGDEMKSVYEIARTTASVFGLNEKLISPIESSLLNEKGKRPPRTGFILDKARSKLTYTPYSLHEGLEVLKTQLMKNGFLNQ